MSNEQVTVIIYNHLPDQILMSIGKLTVIYSYLNFAVHALIFNFCSTEKLNEVNEIVKDYSFYKLIQLAKILAIENGNDKAVALLKRADKIRERRNVFEHSCYGSNAEGSYQMNIDTKKGYKEITNKKVMELVTDINVLAYEIIDCAQELKKLRP